MAEFFERAEGGSGCGMEHFVFWIFRVFVPLLGGVLGIGGLEMLVGKGGWRKGLYGPFGVCGRCMERVLKGFFLL